MTTLADVLIQRRLNPEGIVAIRNTLHVEDMSADFRDMDDVVKANALSMYDRMQDGPRIADNTCVLSFAAINKGQARLAGFRKFMLRRQGNVPGDIVYDYDAAHLLHSFIARASVPIFYDVIDQDGLDDLFGQLVVQWPEPLTENILPADHDRLVVINV